MKSRMTWGTAAAVLLLAGFVQAEVRYSVTNLTLDGGLAGALAINDAGRVAGVGMTGGLDAEGVAVYHPMVWQNSAISDLNPVANANGYAFGINNAGQIAGEIDVDGIGYGFSAGVGGTAVFDAYTLGLGG